MSEDTPEDKTENAAAAAPAKKSSDKKLFLGLAGLFAFLAIMYALSLGPLPEPEVAVTDAEASDVEQAYSAEAEETQETEVAVVEASTSAFDLSAAKTERILGDSSAPIKIAEHSSFSCGHCGKFHRETFGEFKKNYIDTGKAYLVFSDFPLNAPALHATMTARCVPEERYFEFVEKLFAEQDNWAYEQNYLLPLQNAAGEFGLDKDAFKACVNNNELRDALLQRMRAVGSQWEVRSTPSFVVNNQKVIAGSLSYEEFDASLQDALKEIEAENTEPSGSPPTSDEAE